jgi:Zn-dependent metalloprotease
LCLPNLISLVTTIQRQLMKRKSTYFLPILLISTIALLGFQAHQFQHQIAAKDIPFVQQGNAQWYKMKEDARLSVSELLQQHHQDLGLTQNETWINYKTETDQLGMTHYRYQLHHQGIPVEGAELLVHTLDGQVKTFNGCWTPNMVANTTHALSPEEAIAKALAHIPSDKYVWNDSGAERLMKMAHSDPNRTAYPKPELVLYNNTFPNTKGAFQMVYTLIVEAYHPHVRKQLFIDAQTGDIIEEINLHCHTNTPAVAETKYHSTKPIVTDSIAPDSFRLFETTRGIGVHTLDLNNSQEAGDAVDFWDTDNYWNNVNSDQDEAATDAHFSAEMTYDYFSEHLDHHSVDGNDTMQMICLVHYGNSVVNAFWNGSWCTLGDGGGPEWSALTSLDVVGHEFAHGVTQKTANLIYQDEPGGLNESFSDIFGTAVEFWGDSSTGDYYIGEDFHNFGNGFRNMSNPYSEGHPDTYLGNGWVTGAQDNGGVHTNSGVQNFWFYLMAEGGSGTNDNGFQFQVEGVGIDTAAMIAFRNLKYYLTRFSQYSDARHGSLVAAEDLYGPCSFPAQQTINAWRAVGIGYLYDHHDFEMIQYIGMDSLNCGLSNAEFPTIQMRYNGCLSPLGANALVPLEIVVDNGPIQRDTILLPNGLTGGDTIVYTIDTPISGLQTMGSHTITTTVAMPFDSISNNNTVSFLLENVLAQNTDFQGDRFLRPDPDCFMAAVPVEIEVTFLGCDTIPPGATLFLNYDFQGTVVTESTTLSSGFSRGESFSYTFNTPLDASGYNGFNDIIAWVNFPPDFIAVNDSTTAKVLNPDLLFIDRLITLEYGDNSLDSFYAKTTDYSDIYISDLADFESEYGIYMTGKNPASLLDAGLLTAFNTPDSAWLVNESVSAMVCVCADATSLSNLELSFAMRLVHSQYFNVNLGVSSPYSSALRVLVNGEQASETYTSVPSISPWSQETVNLSAYGGELLEICFESRCMASVEFSGLGDRVYLDNILLSGSIVSSQEPAKPFYQLSASPNPANDQLIIHYGSNQKENLNLELFDVHGRLVWSKAVGATAGSGQTSVSLSQFAAGVYYLRLGDGHTYVHEPIVVLR